MRNIEYNKASDFNYTYDGRTLSILGLKDHSLVEVKIPPVIEGVPVTVIGNGAFMGYKSLKYLEMPDTVTIVDNSAFKNCENLREVVLSKELASIGAFAFAGCTALKRITISNHTDRVEMNTFKDCTSLHYMDVKHRESDQIDTYAIASDSHESIWLYSRAVLRGSAPGGGRMDKYDATFLEIQNEDDRFRVATFRLQNDRDLDDSMRKIYRDCLIGMIMNIIRTDRVDRLTLLGRLDCIDTENLSMYIDLAGRIGGGCIAYLLEHQNRVKPGGLSDFAL